MTTKSRDKEALPAQPLDRYRLLKVISDKLETANGKTGIGILINSGEVLDAMGEVLPDQELLNKIFIHVKDGDERAIVRRFFANLDD